MGLVLFLCVEFATFRSFSPELVCEDFPRRTPFTTAYARVSVCSYSILVDLSVY